MAWSNRNQQRGHMNGPLEWIGAIGAIGAILAASLIARDFGRKKKREIERAEELAEEAGAGKA